MKKKIRKAYTLVRVSEKFKAKKLSPYKDSRNARLRSIKNKLYFPTHFPPYQSLFYDDEGHLFVMTYEDGENAGEYIWDIFSDEGIFIGRVGIGNFGIWERMKWS